MSIDAVNETGQTWSNISKSTVSLMNLQTLVFVASHNSSINTNEIVNQIFFQLLVMSQNVFF